MNTKRLWYNEIKYQLNLKQQNFEPTKISASTVILTLSFGITYYSWYIANSMTIMYMYSKGKEHMFTTSTSWNIKQIGVWLIVFHYTINVIDWNLKILCISISGTLTSTISMVSNITEIIVSHTIVH